MEPSKFGMGREKEGEGGCGGEGEAEGEVIVDWQVANLGFGCPVC